MNMQSNTRDSWAIEAIKSNPEGLLLLAAGCALLMRSSPRRHTSAARSFGSEAQTKPTRTMAERASETAQSAGEFATRVADKASDYASTVSDYAEDIYSGRVVQEASSTIQTTIDRVAREQPLVIALAGAAAGAAVAAAFPVTELENRTLGATGEHLRRAAGEAGEHLKEAASKAGERVIAAVDEHGLNEKGVREVTREVGDALGGALKPAEDQVARKSAQSLSANERSSRSKG